MQKGLYYPLVAIFIIVLHFQATGQYAWIKKNNFPGNPRDAASAFSINGIGYLGNGDHEGSSNSNYYDFWSYNPATDSWTQLADIGNVPRSQAATFVVNGKGYVGGGVSGPDGTILQDLWQYDPSTNIWTQKNNIPGGARWGCVATVVNNMAYFGFGDYKQLSGAVLANDLWVYDDIKDDWLQLTNFPSSGRLLPTIFALDTTDNGNPNAIFVGLGWDGNSDDTDWWKYDPAIDKWTQKQNFPGAGRTDATIFTLNGYGFVGDGGPSDIYRYDSKYDNWHTVPSFPLNQVGGASSFVIGNVAYVACGVANGSLDIEVYEFVIPVIYDTVTATICQGQSYDGHTSTGSYIDSFLLANGFDSIRILNLTVTEGSRIDESVTICQGDSYRGYTATGTYRDTFVSSSGCDSIYNLDLTVLPSYVTEIEKTICGGQSYMGQTFSGVYADTFTAYNGCDSVFRLRLTVLPFLSDTVNQGICPGQSFDGYSATGTYRDTFITANGCDSLRILNLSVTVPIEMHIVQTICSGATFEGYDQTGIYVDTFIAQGGCDSIRTLDLFVNPVIRSSVNQTICAGQSYGGYSQAGLYVDTFPTISGCDSIRTLNLTVIPENDSIIKQQICEGEIYDGHSSSGVYIDTFQALNGCDSLVILELNVYTGPIIPPLLQVGDTLIAISGYQYQWYENNTLLPGDTGSHLLINSDAYYAVQVTDSDGCSNQSPVFYAYPTGIEQTIATNYLDIFPDPNKGQFTVAFNQPFQFPALMKLTNIAGQILWSRLLNENPSSPLTITTDLSQGVYIFSIQNDEVIWNKKLIVE